MTVMESSRVACKNNAILKNMLKICEQAYNVLLTILMIATIFCTYSFIIHIILLVTLPSQFNHIDSLRNVAEFIIHVFLSL